MNNEQQKQCGRDLKDFGERAYLMWDLMGTVVIRLTSNKAMLSWLKEKPDLLKRKGSAELPFNIERAIAGDAVVFLNESDGKYYDCEIKRTGKGLVCYQKFPPDQSVYVDSIYQKQMFMKFPPKVSSGSRGSNHE